MKFLDKLKNIVRKKEAFNNPQKQETNIMGNNTLSVFNEGERLGFTMYKRWVATADEKCRTDHLKMNGVTIPKDELFKLPDGSLMSEPRDSTHGASLSQTEGCRCCMIAIIKDFEETSRYSDTEKETQKAIDSILKKRKHLGQ